MDAFVTEKDFVLLRQDRCSFSVLDRILRGPCAIVRSNHESLILCHSTPPYPVWIWTRDGLTEEEKETAWKLAEACCPLSGGYRLMMKYELAYAFLEKARGAGLGAKITKQLFSYSCPKPLRPELAAEGYARPCRPEELAEAAGLLSRFYAEIGEHPLPEERVLQTVREKIEQKRLFFWKDPADKTVACCGRRDNGDLATVNDVYTLPEERRKHYAQNLVYTLTKQARDEGFLPILYTNAAYAPSNACYQKIGYELRGRLCTVSLPEAPEEGRPDAGSGTNA